MTEPIESLIASLRGFPSKNEDRIIAEIVSQANSAATNDLGDRLARSRWPLCNSLAIALARIGTQQAKESLIGCLSAKKHHVRTAVVKALVELPDTEGVRQSIEPLIKDPALETRAAVEEALAILDKRH